jgi:metal-responsive CopG/Arc/MetJ family transcriptional regulator
MQETITFILPAEIKPAFDNATREEGITPSELIREAINEYLFLRKFKSLRERMILQAQQQGISSEQEVFDRVS